MKFAVVGSRTIDSEEYVYTILDKSITTNDEVITGGARGIDSIAEKYCKEKNIKCTVIRPIDESIKAHYLYRNVEMVTLCDRIIVIWDGQSRGTRFTMDYAAARQKPSYVFSNTDMRYE